MSFPSTPILDDFNRADESPLSFGGQWNERALSTVFTMSSLSNQAISQATQATLATRRWINGGIGSYGQDHEVYAKLAGNWTLGNSSISVYSRVHDVTLSARKGYYAVALRQAGTIEFNVYNGVTVTLLNSISFTLASGDGIGLRSVGSQHYVFVYQSGTWSEVMLVNDSTYVGGTYDLGLGLGTQNPRADDFGGGNINFGQIIRHRRRSSIGS